MASRSHSPNDAWTHLTPRLSPADDDALVEEVLQTRNNAVRDNGTDVSSDTTAQRSKARSDSPQWGAIDAGSDSPQSGGTDAASDSPLRQGTDDESESPQSVVTDARSESSHRVLPDSGTETQDTPETSHRRLSLPISKSPENSTNRSVDPEGQSQNQSQSQHRRAKHESPPNIGTRESNPTKASQQRHFMPSSNPLEHSTKASFIKGLKSAKEIFKSGWDSFSNLAVEVYKSLCEMEKTQVAATLGGLWFANKLYQGGMGYALSCTGDVVNGACGGALGGFEGLTEGLGRTALTTISGVRSGLRDGLVPSGDGVHTWGHACGNGGGLKY